MLRTVNVRDETTSTLAKIRCAPVRLSLFAPAAAPSTPPAPPPPQRPFSDFGYAFEIIHEFLDTFHAQIRQDPFSVLLLRATFLKIVRSFDAHASEKN
jgi:hypothetical protein